MPEMIIVVSDMQFDRCGHSTNFESIQRQYQNAGYDMPKLVFWNVNSRVTENPVTQDENGTYLVSGASSGIFKAVLNTKVTTSYDLMLETLNDKRYGMIEEVVGGIL